MIHLDLFSGIGGFALACDWHFKDIEHVFCDNEPFSQEVLAKHWPNSKIYGDIRSLSKKQFLADTRSKEPLGLSQKSRTKGFEIGDVHILTGGFPCQPFSQAGRRRGTEDDRYLWPEMFRVICDFKPTWIVAENVRGLLTWNGGMVLEQVCLDLEGQGYEVQPLIIPALAVNAPHRRDRIWFIAYAKHKQTGYSESGRNEKGSSARAARSDTNSSYTKREGYKGKVDKKGSSAGYNRGSQSPDWTANWAEVASELCRVDDGISRRLDRNSRLKALGNAIVPQVAYQIIKNLN